MNVQGTPLLIAMIALPGHAQMTFEQRCGIENDVAYALQKTPDQGHYKSCGGGLLYNIVSTISCSTCI